MRVSNSILSPREHHEKLLVATCIVLAGSANAMAQTAAKSSSAIPKAHTSTEAFVQMCTNKADGAAQNFCNGFGQGVYETYLMTRHPKKHVLSFA